MKEKSRNNKGRYTWHANVSSMGTLDLSLYFPQREGWTNEKKEEALALALSDAQGFMLQKGYLPPGSHCLSPRDVAKQYGHTRQYWEKLLKEKKIPYKETAAGMITTDLWVQGYLNNKEEVDKYVRQVNQAIKSIHENKSRHGTMSCPKCTDDNFSFHINTGNINGLCYSCGFRVHTTD